MNAKTNVRFEAVGTEIRLFLNNTLDGFATVSGERYSGAATVFVSDPWYTPASALISSIKMTAISRTSTILTTSVVDQTAMTTTTITENTYTTTRRVITVYFDDDLNKVVTAPAEINAASATVYTTIYTPVVVFTNKTIIETSTTTPATFVSTIRDTATVVLPTVTFTATV